MCPPQFAPSLCGFWQDDSITSRDDSPPLRLLLHTNLAYAACVGCLIRGLLV